jgi:hypothetical protein
MSEPEAEVDPVDRALTVATRSRRRQGRGAEATRAEYAREWGRWCEWRHPFDPTKASAELLATYASAQCAAGRAVATVRKAIAAIESELRSRGKEVPDSVPAHVVLREIDDSRKAAGLGSKPAEPLLLDDFVRMLASLDQTTTQGQRDAVILHLLFAGLRIGEIEPLDLGDVEVAHSGTASLRLDGDERLAVAMDMRLAGATWEAIAERAGYESGDAAKTAIGAALDASQFHAPLPTIRVRVRGDEGSARAEQVLTLLHWRSETGVHDARLCPAEAVARLAFRMSGYPGAASWWPLLRPVDQSGRIGGLDPGWAGSLGPTGGRLSAKKMGLAFTRALVAAGLHESGRRLVPLSLKMGGAGSRLAQRVPGLGAFAVGAWSTSSRAVADLLREYTPDDAGIVAMTWQLSPEMRTALGIDVPPVGVVDDGA